MAEVIEVSLQTAQILSDLFHKEIKSQVPISYVRDGLVQPAPGVKRISVQGDEWVVLHFNLTAKGIKVLEALVRLVYPGVHDVDPDPDPIVIMVRMAEMEKIRAAVAHFPAEPKGPLRVVPDVRGEMS